MAKLKNCVIERSSINGISETVYYKCICDKCGDDSNSNNMIVLNPNTVYEGGYQCMKCGAQVKFGVYGDAIELY